MPLSYLLVMCLLGIIVILPLFLLSFFYFHFIKKRISSFKQFMAEPQIPFDKMVPISVIIAFRNESKNLPRLLSSLNLIDYQKFEIIFVNDESTDDGELKIDKNNFILLKNAYGPGKKGALKTGIAAAKHEYIVTLDADVSVFQDILKNYAAHFNTGAHMVLGPVGFTPGSSFTSHYAMLENSSLVAWSLSDASLGKPSMANGANLGFCKKKYNEVNGYKSHQHLASGDDEFLLHEFLKIGTNIQSMKGGMVYTNTVDTWRSFAQQRSRWASKIKNYDSVRSAKYHKSQLAIFAWLFYIMLNLKLGGVLYIAIPIGLKIYSDISWFNCIRPYFKMPFNVFKIMLSSILQLIILPSVYLYGFFFKTHWKGRKIN